MDLCKIVPDLKVIKKVRIKRNQIPFKGAKQNNNNNNNNNNKMYIFRARIQITSYLSMALYNDKSL